ncbi:MAG: CDP-glucose 4,6-dehydratase [Paenibacillaceae bacterium]|nr:CDP-glucose 4,6-dehydratase [Paenibacillaceae bacterium]
MTIRGNDSSFWNGKHVLITGNTGFKGSWLGCWLNAMGARVSGFSLHPPTHPSLYAAANLAETIPTVFGDVLDLELLCSELERLRPDIVFHMAAQPLVRTSYEQAVETYMVNVMGTVHLLEAVRRLSAKGSPVRAVVMITTDKCYANRETLRGYKERDPLGGADPYSGSKSCAELATASYRHSFFPPQRYAEHGVAVATARAGNVIGGGDWAADRLLPDCLRTLETGGAIRVRRPDAVRPWQHVLEPLGGYLLLARRLFDKGAIFAEAWNFGPNSREAQTVEWVVDAVCRAWGDGARFEAAPSVTGPHESRFLLLDSAKAQRRLGWQSVWSAAEAVDRTVAWHKAYLAGDDARELMLREIESYEDAAAGVASR